MSVTIKKVDGQSITIIIPASGETGWAQIVKDAFKALSEHTHTGSGTGAQLSSSALQDESVKATKIHSDVAGTALSKNNTSKALDVQVDDSSIEIHTDNNLRLKDDGITQAKLHPDLDTLVNKITPNETNIATNAANISSNDTDIAANTSSIAALTVNDLTDVSTSTPTSGQVLSWNSSANEWRNTEPTGGSGSGSGGGGTGIITDWQEYTPTLTNITLGNGSQEWTYRRVGSDIEITGNVLLGSTSSVSGVMQFSLPSGLSTDLFAYADVNNSRIVTYGHANVVTGSGNLGRYDIQTNGSSTTDFIITGTKHDGVTGDWDSSFPLNSWGAGHQFNVRMTAPISSWATGTTSVDTGELPTICTINGLTSAQILAGGDYTLTNWNTPFKDTKSAWDSTNSKYVVPESGYYDVNFGISIVQDGNADMWRVMAMIKVDTDIIRESAAVTGGTETNFVNVTAIGYYMEAGSEITFMAKHDNVNNEQNKVQDMGGQRTYIDIAKRETVQTTVINAPETVSLFATLSSNQAISSSTTNKIELDGTTEDTINGFVPSTDDTDNNGYYLIPSTGYYYISAQVGTDNILSTDILYCLVTKNTVSGGAPLLRGSNRSGSHSSTDVEFAQASGVLKLNKDDKIFLCVDVYADTAYDVIATSNVTDTFLNIHKLESGTTVYPEPVEATPVICTANIDGSSTQTFAHNTTDYIEDFTTVTDTTNSFNSSTGVYTVPETGYYDIQARAVTDLNASQKEFTSAIWIIVCDASGTPVSTPASDNGILVISATTLNGTWVTGRQSSADASCIGTYLEKDQLVKVQFSALTSDSSAVSMAGGRFQIAKREAGTTVYPEPVEATPVACKAFVNADYTRTDAASHTILFNETAFDTHSGFDTSTGVYTFPESGYYLITANVILTGFQYSANMRITDGVSSHVYTYFTSVDRGQPEDDVGGTTLTYMNYYDAGDTTKVYIDPQGGNEDNSYTVQGNSSMGGTLVSHISIAKLG